MTQNPQVERYEADEHIHHLFPTIAQPLSYTKVRRDGSSPKRIVGRVRLARVGQKSLQHSLEGAEGEQS
jgi:hypothetical protein